MRHTGFGQPKETSAGIWPTVDKAKEIADQTVKRLLNLSVPSLDRIFKLRHYLRTRSHPVATFQKKIFCAPREAGHDLRRATKAGRIASRAKASGTGDAEPGYGPTGAPAPRCPPGSVQKRKHL